MYVAWVPHPVRRLTDTWSVHPSASLSDAIEFPFDWPSVANEQLYPTVVAILTAGRAYGFTDPYILPENPVEPPPVNSSSPPPSSYPLEAIAGADGVQSNGVPLKNVFDDLVATTRDRTPICTSLDLVFSELWVDGGPQSVPYGPVCEFYCFPGTLFVVTDG